jgi:hypothetical protein
MTWLAVRIVLALCVVLLAIQQFGLVAPPVPEHVASLAPVRLP